MKNTAFFLLNNQGYNGGSTFHRFNDYIFGCFFPNHSIAEMMSRSRDHVMAGSVSHVISFIHWADEFVVLLLRYLFEDYLCTECYLLKRLTRLAANLQAARPNAGRSPARPKPTIAKPQR